MMGEGDRNKGEKSDGMRTVELMRAKDGLA
jgi:hypothetical protein